MSKRKNIQAEEKIALVKDYLNNKIGLKEAARRAGVDRETTKQWVWNYEADGVDAFLPHKNRAYSAELKQKAVEEINHSPHSDM